MKKSLLEKVTPPTHTHRVTTAQAWEWGQKPLRVCAGVRVGSFEICSPKGQVTWELWLRPRLGRKLSSSQM